MKSISVKAKIENTEEVIEFIKKSLSSYKVKKKDLTRSLLLSEESFVNLVKGAEENYNVNVYVKKSIYQTKIVFKCKGSLIACPISNVSDNKLLDDSTNDEQTESVIRNLIIKANEERISSSHKNGINTITIVCNESSQKTLIHSLIAMGLGAVLGILFKYIIPGNINDMIDYYFFDPVSTIFLKAIKAFVGPLIFFSIASSIGSFTDIKELGRLGIKILRYYILTSIIAIFVGLGIFYSTDIVEFNELSNLSSGVIAESQGDITLIGTLTGIIPTDIVSPFLNMDFLQIIFIAVMIGIVTPMLGACREAVSNFLNCGNELFSKAISIIVKGIPLLIFASMFKMFVKLNFEEIKPVLMALVLVYVGNIVISLLYTVYVLVFAKRNPFTYFKNAIPAYLNGYALSSSNACIPFTMKVCENNLKISPKLYTFSIPLGATINMDGVSVSLVILTLFFAKAFGIEIGIAELIKLAISVTVISLGSPGVPGTLLISISLLASLFGLPQEVVMLTAGLNSLIDPADTATNVFGDVTGTYITAVNSGLVNENASEE